MRRPFGPGALPSASGHGSLRVGPMSSGIGTTCAAGCSAGWSSGTPRGLRVTDRVTAVAPR
eukprot:7082006-Alexandrium_andersonii.AAC.1